LLALLVAVVFAGCGAPGPGSPRQIVKKAIDAQGDLKSVHMEMDVTLQLEGGPGDSHGASRYLRGEGYFEKPDKSRMTVKTGSGQVEVVAVGGRLFVKTAGAASWTEQEPSRQPLSGFSPGDVADYLKYTKGLQLVDVKKGTYHLKFDLDMGRYTQRFRVPDVDPSVFKGMDAHMEVWILEDSYYIEKAKMSFAGDLSKVGRGKVSMSTEIEFSEFNQPVTIEAPM